MALIKPIFSYEHLAQMPDDGCLHELARGDTVYAAVNEKVDDYLAGGARVVWLLYPKTRTVEAFKSDWIAWRVPARGMLEGGEMLPGFAEEISNICA